MDFKPSAPLLASVIALALAACQQPAAPPAETAASTSKAAPPARHHTSDFAAVLELFASPDGHDWIAYSALPGIKWIESTPREEAPGRYTRSGNLLLLGFAEATIPNGQPGLEYATDKRNEGESRLTLIGTLSGVESISIQKPLYTDDYAGLLKNQYSAATTISLIAYNCRVNASEDGAASGAFFAIKQGSETAVYVRAAQEGGGKYSAGYTVFELTKKRPSHAIAAENCETPE